MKQGKETYKTTQLTMKRQIIIACMMAVSLAVTAQKPMTAPHGGKVISDQLIGIFFEDISYAADGGLHAELVQNGSFEYNANERDGWGSATAWKVVRHGHSLGFIQPTTRTVPGPRNQGYYSNSTMRLHVERAKEYYDYKGWKGVGLQNDGFDGISLKGGEKYDFSMRVSNIFGKSEAKQMRVALIEPQRGKAPKVLADTVIDIAAVEMPKDRRQMGNSWKMYTATLVPNADCQKAALQVLMLTEGDIYLDDVSLMPQDTYMGHGLRKDLVQALAELKPKFMRFPGGCIVHGGGDGMWNTYRWKNTIGPRHLRQQQKNTWGYHQSMALGYYEYFQLCEDLQMEPLPILPCGVSCQGAGGGWGMKGHAQDAVPMEEMDEWVQDALDLIEWANGDPATSKWAKMRADQGHPAPFNLKYLGIGNEEYISPEFAERFTYMYNKIRKAHPEIIIVGTAGPGSHPGNHDFENGWKLAEELQVPILDEHYYEKHDFFLNSRQYDKYPRNRKTKVYLGEYAAKDKKLIDALAEALYLLHVERNGDVVCMTSYAPLLARTNHTSWNPDLIYFDNDHVYPTCSYYVQQMFGQSAGQYYYGNCVRFEGDKAKVVQPTEKSRYGQSVVLNVKTRRLYVKLCNAGDVAKTAQIDLSRFPVKGMATKTTLTGKPNDENGPVFKHPHDKDFKTQMIVSPKKEQVKAEQRFNMEVAPYSFIMLEYEL